MNFLAAPIRPKPFLEQTCYDEEYRRRRAWDGQKWVNYVRGKHGGFDFQDGRGPTFAVWNGDVRHVDFGSSLGEFQFVIVNKDGLAAFYAHTSSRPKEGRVKAGQKLKRPNGRLVRIGRSGTAFDHLHFEVLKDADNWSSCVNPGPALRRLQSKLAA